MLRNSDFYCRDRRKNFFLALLAALAQWFGEFFHLKDLIFVILRKWMLNVICQEAKWLCCFLSRLEFYSNNSVYQ